MGEGPLVIAGMFSFETLAVQVAIKILVDFQNYKLQHVFVGAWSVVETIQIQHGSKYHSADFAN